MPVLSVVPAVILCGQCRPIEHLGGAGQVQSPGLQGGRTLRFVELDSHNSCYYNKYGSRTFLTDVWALGSPQRRTGAASWRLGQDAVHGFQCSSRLPAVKTLDQFDFSFQPSIKREQIESLHELGFLERAENVILLGPPGVGKTHLAISLAIAAAESGRKVYYSTLAALIDSLTERHRVLPPLVVVQQRQLKAEGKIVRGLDDDIRGYASVVG